MPARIAGANMTRLNVTGIFETIEKSKTCGLLLLRVCVNPSDVGDPLRPAHHEPGDATRLCDRYRFRERPVRAGAAAHGAGYGDLPPTSTPSRKNQPRPPRLEGYAGDRLAITA